MTGSGVPARDERRFLAEAVRLAVDNGSAGQLPFDALVVRAGEVLATGVNTALRDAVSEDFRILETVARRWAA